ncbi:SusC/RagA family TonB-linked outer membrane protein [Flammeovirga yaeyamensis]|uniref:SusC/RagA family TonB-linked outer membrane protein n=1 Tax=Flammeovirga yaeyamensis TaxID=367791 RepID=A0AAX1NDP9_9BACT|nr:TonB-dependent receptor [Flammeovirga yaeyamensis]MBB3696631.1 TonB-linked SusC/RagA family outer membrane protein [Flammeovirga yaeyamensis]NMF33304.1 TonB-dependent receptor [Flammeovirga yaeyamensis]QWG05417.1 SusC/RagA family TonB-linked outer membrane protein [Flammeovirga yaeyamensis]
MKLLAQDKLTVSGIVTSSDDGIPMPGVNVVIQGTDIGTITTIDGKYKLNVSPNDVITFSFIGYVTESVNVGGRTKIDFTIKPDLEQLDEVVVIGYGEQNRRDVTGGIVSVKSDELTQATPSSALEGMQGRLSGVSITSNGGPGAGSEISIRGTSTLNSGTGPLYVVDGQQMEDINNLNPEDIESIEVLKDGASAAIYGSKSANGVIIITTKSGKAGKTKINASFVQGWNTLASKIPVSNTRQAKIYADARKGNDKDATPLDSLSTIYNQDFDYQDMITRVSQRQQFGLSLSGGTEAANFYWNTGYIGQDGVVNNSDYLRYNTTLNVNFKATSWLKAGTRIMGSYSEQNGLNTGAVFGQISTHFPYLPVQDADGTFIPQTSSQQNILAETLFTERRRRKYRGQAFGFAEFQILPSLKFKSTIGIDVHFKRNNDFNPTIVQPMGRDASGSQTTEHDFSIQQENYLSWKKKFKDHNISAMVGMQTQTWTDEYARFESNSFNNDINRTFNNVAELTAGNSRTETEKHSIVSQYGRFTYDFKGKYLVAATIRRDGSSRFGENNKYGIFPGASVGWRISDEFFMKPLKPVLSDMKFRAGVSQNGNERIPNFESRTLYQPGYFYDGVNGIGVSQLGNPDLVWETTQQAYVGVDLGLFEDKININVDYYEKLTSDLLYSVPLPQETGFSSVRSNIGEIKNSGLEFNISANIINKENFQWYSSFNIATNVNEIVKLAEKDGRIIQGEYIIEEGGSIGDIYGYTALGVFPYDESNAFDNDGNQLTPIFDDEGNFTRYELNGREYSGEINQLKVQNRVLEGGDVHWQDHDGDFNIDADNDRSVIGNGLPELFGGLYNEFSYKGIKLSVLFDFNFGNDIYKKYDETRNQRLVTTVVPGPERIDGAWYEQGDVARYPTLYSKSASKNNLGPNTFWISKADFIKLRSVRIDYSLPKTLMDKVSFMSNVSFYVSGLNLLTWTNFDGYNPELGSNGNALKPGLDNLRYPLSREYLAGIQVQF